MNDLHPFFLFLLIWGTPTVLISLLVWFNGGVRR